MTTTMDELLRPDQDWALHQGDCRDFLPGMPDASVDFILTDPPYPMIKRSYGYWTEAEWFDLMRAVVPQCMRVLKPHGSAVFILQPNSERVGRMRTWLSKFELWVGRKWGIVQDHYWWNTSTLPVGGANTEGLLRPSVRRCIWVGSPDCYRDQDAVLLTESAGNLRDRTKIEAAGFKVRSQVIWDRECHGMGDLEGVFAPQHDVIWFATKGRFVFPGKRPKSVLRFQRVSASSLCHPNEKPLPLVVSLVRSLSSVGDVVFDPFVGSGTTLVACMKTGRRGIGIEIDPGFIPINVRRLTGAETPLFAGLES